ncbi:hypothetical protein, partial [Enterobacter sp. CPE_E222]|uniref:hypothetical protein n=1 Tax=Enterobacter sp. CPE_E222 TaxID=3383890 RepID=UPI003976E2C2
MQIALQFSLLLQVVARLLERYRALFSPLVEKRRCKHYFPSCLQDQELPLRLHQTKDQLHLVLTRSVIGFAGFSFPA